MEKIEVSETLEPQNPDAKTLEEGSGLSGLFGLDEDFTGLASFEDLPAEEMGKRVEVDGVYTDSDFGVENVQVSKGIELDGVDGGFKATGDNGIEEGCVLKDDVDGDEKIAGEEGVEVNDADFGLLAGNADEKIEVAGGGISLVVEFNIPSSRINLDDIRGANNYEFLTGGDDSKEDVNGEEMIDKRECKYLVGDIVWVKTKSQTWWPGKINDPSAASKLTAKSDPRHCLLVGYFGSGHTAWCSPSQLKHFHENFEQKLGQYKSKSFTGAVQKAVYEFGKCVQSEMACSCILNKGQLPVNDSRTTEEHVSAPNRKFRELGKFSVGEFRSVNFLEHIKYVARAVCTPGMLELVVSRNQLAAFYRSMGHSLLPMHQLTESTDVKGNVRDSRGAKKKANSRIKGAHPLSSKPLRKNVNVFVKSNKCDDTAEGSQVKGSNEPQGLDSNGFVEGNLDKGLDSRERRKSRYLSYPYIDLGHKGLPHESEGVANGQDEEAGNTPSIVKCNGQKTLQKGLGKLNTSGNPDLVNASSADLLSELRFTALDCMHPNGNQKFGSVEWFFYKYRALLYHDELDGETLGEPNVVQMTEMGAENCPPIAKSEPKKRKRKGKAILGPSEAGHASDVQDVNGQPDMLGAGSQPSEVKPKWKRRKKEDASSQIKPPSVLSDVQDMNGQPDALGVSNQPSEVKPKRKWRKKEVASSQIKPPSVLSDVQDVNGQLDELGVSNQPSEVKPKRKWRKKVDASSQIKPPSVLSDVQDVNGQPDALGVSSQPSEVKPKRKWRKKVDVGSHVILPSVPSDVSASIPTISPPASTAKAEPDENKGTDGQTPVFLQTPGIPDLNGSSTMLSFGTKDLQAVSNFACAGKPQPKKRKRKEANATTTVCSPAQTSGGVLDANGNNIERGSPFIAFQPVTLPNISENNVQSAGGLLDFSINTAKLDLLKNPQEIGLVMPEGKPIRKRRKRKEKATVEQLNANLAAGIPDLNGTSSEPSTLGQVFQDTTILPPQVKPERKRRRRINKGEPVQIPELSMGYGRAEARGDTPGTALLLTFAQGADLPSKEVLAERFCRFGSLKESETQVLKDSLSARVVFTKGADAAEAFQSLQQTNPFGTTVVNYRLHHLSAASQPKEGYKAPPKPPPSEAPPLDFIKQNLKMMTSMLAEAGDNLSQEMRAKLECEIRGLMSKVSAMSGSSTS